MNKNELIASTEERLNESLLLLNGLKDASGKLPQVEIDLAKEKIRLIYDMLLELEKKNYEVYEPGAEKTLPPEEEPQEEKPQNIVNVQILQMEDESSEIETEEVVTEEDITPQPDLQQQKDLSDLDLFTEPSVISQVDMNLTVVDKIAEGQNEESVADKMQKNKITGLKSAIGINEKFFFINELFEGNMKEYNEAIEKLEDCKSIELAIELISKLTEERDWNIESDALIQMQGFVERKFK